MKMTYFYMNLYLKTFNIIILFKMIWNFNFVELSIKIMSLNISITWNIHIDVLLKHNLI